MPVSVPFLSAHRSFTIELAEPVVYLRGLPSNPATHVLRGEAVLVLSKPITATSVTVKVVGKSHTLWPEGIGARGTKMSHEKTIHEQNMILQTFAQGDVIPAGLHRWPFEFLLPNSLVETIEDEMAKVYYYVSATVHRGGMGGVTNLRSRRDILLMRTMNWSDDSTLTSHATPPMSISTERHLDNLDAQICIEKTIVSSGTQLPLSISISPTQKHVHLESINIMLTEQRVYRLPEFGARRSDGYDYKLKMASATDICEVETDPIPPIRLARAITTKNAHISLDNHHFFYRFMFHLPNCVTLNHTSTYHEVDIKHYLRMRIELSQPHQSERTVIHFETPITILDCRLKEDFSALPTYEESLSNPKLEDEEAKPTGFFVCPCYLEYRKKRKCSRQEWMSIRQHSQHENNNFDGIPPPPYERLLSEKQR
ncbi:hypothetical protein BCR43DRAFT_454333 [Syncephalastrum racemosum]|uniref:Arrestin-like N-terminal domain-containing protein n=1 Tax=Syncephalastrum racemosum TaxID=13706 RepID=A0A1X2HQS6_SYNRA|nr:hypothetical protein BCR43DRAFT_454333 [Syncephalastrum racemosum]